MGFIQKVKEWFSVLLETRAEQDFDLIPIEYPATDYKIRECLQAYKGQPYWVDDEIRTINFARSVCSETARLATLAIGISVSGGARAEWIQEQLEKCINDNLRKWVEYGCAAGTMLLSPDGAGGVDCYLPGEFLLTDVQGDVYTGVVLHTMDASSDGKKYYHRFEHRAFDMSAHTCTIRNKCYVSANPNDYGRPCDIATTPWADLEPETTISNVERPLFGVFRTPAANNVDTSSPLSLPIFADALEEFKDLDIAYSRNSTEIFDSARTILIDSDRIMQSGERVKMSADGYDATVRRYRLPRITRIVEGNGADAYYQEINPTLNTDARMVGINALLSQIGYKCGFSNGYFVFNQSTGLATATQVEADQQRTIQFIKDVRDQLQACMDGLIYSMSVFEDLMGDTPAGDYEVTYDFGDITYNRDEDRSRWYSYVNSGRIPFWFYLVKFEGFSEEDAKAIAIEDEFQQDNFGAEE